jgi:type I restriction enzyme S subunit
VTIQFSELIEATLSDVCSLVTDGTHDTPQRVKLGYPLIKAKKIVGGQIDFETCDQISKEEHLKVVARSKPEFGDTLFAHIGASLGEAAFVNTPREFSIKNIALFKPNPTIIDSRYLYYIVISPVFQALAKRTRTGSAQPFLGLSQLRSHRIQYHRDMAIQRRIAGILSAYDQLIENNQRRIKILEEMARALYREWFVHFRFPGHEKVKMVPSSLGLIPEGWGIGVLGNHVEFKSGFAFRSGTFSTEGEYRLVTIKNVQDGSFNPECDSRVGKLPDNLPSHCVLEDGDILLSLTGNVGRACLVYDGPFFLNQRVAKLVPTESTDWAIIYCMFRETAMRIKLEQLSTGVAQQNLSPVLASRMEVVTPPRELRKRFLNSVEAMIKNLVHLHVRNDNLRRTRDLLLPRLLSGSLSISEPCI